MKKPKLKKGQEVYFLTRKLISDLMIGPGIVTGFYVSYPTKDTGYTIETAQGAQVCRLLEGCYRTEADARKALLTQLELDRRDAQQKVNCLAADIGIAQRDLKHIEDQIQLMRDQEAT